MIKPAQLKLDILTEQHRRELVNALRGSVVIITDTEIKGYKDGREQDLGLDIYAAALRFNNGNGIYAVPEDTADASDQGQAPEGITAAIKDIWTKRRMAGRLSAIASNNRLAPRDIYAARRGQVSA